MKFGLEGKVAFVTGGSKSLGLAAATALADEGCRVAIMGRDRERLGIATERPRKHGDVMAVVGDVTVNADLPKAWNEVRRELGDPEIFVYNNSGPANTYFENVTDEELAASHDLTVRGFLWCMREVILHNTFRLAQLGMSKTLAKIDRQRVVNVPAGRLVRPEELGALCAFLGSEHAGLYHRTGHLSGWRPDAVPGVTSITIPELDARYETRFISAK